MNAPSARDGFVSRGGVRIHFLEWASAPQPNMLLLPGLGGGGGSALSWLPFVRAIGTRRRIVAIEQRGHGHSDWAGTYRWQDVVADIDAVVEALSLAPMSVVGHSAGGTWGYLYAAEHPAKVERLVDVDSGAPYRLLEPPPQPPILPAQTDFLELARGWSSATVDDAVQEWIRDATIQTDDGRWTWRQDPRVWSSAFRGEMCASPDEFLDRARLVRCPVLIVRGTESELFPRAKADRLAAAVPNGVVVEVPNAGHVVHLANPTGFAEAVAGFLQLE